MPPDPRWLAIATNDAEDDAWHELEDRLERVAEYAPASIFDPRIATRLNTEPVRVELALPTSAAPPHPARRSPTLAAGGLLPSNP